MANQEATQERVIDKVVRQIFETMVRLPLSEAEARLETVLPKASAFVMMTGREKRLLLVLETSEYLAVEICSALIGERKSAWDDEVSDSLGEVTNMIAGNIKTALAVPGLVLAMPTVTHGQDYQWKSSGSLNWEEETFLCCGDQLTVRLGRPRI